MEIEKSTKDAEIYTYFQSEFEKIKNQNFILATTNGFINILKENKKGLKYNIKKLFKDFLIAFFFKSSFKISRTLDRSWSKSISLEQTVDNIINFSNVKYGLFVIMIKLLFKFYRFLIKIFKLNDYLEYKRVNILLGVITNLILLKLGKKSTLTFLLCIYYLLKNIISFYNSHSYINDRRVYKESKNFYMIGFALAYIITNLTIKENRENIKIFQYFI
jgi:hypothetical protein